jgi:hypothetical protein
MNDQYYVYQLVCTSKSYIDSITPRSVLVSGFAGFDNTDVHFMASGFYSLSKDPVHVLEDAIQHLIERRREFQLDMLELDDLGMGAGEGMESVEYVMPDGVVQEEAANLTQVSMLLQDAAHNHLEMVQGIHLTVTEAVSFKDSLSIDKAKRFLNAPDEFIGIFSIPDTHALAMQTRQQLRDLKEFVKYRLLGRVEFQEQLDKLVYDLEQRFPAETYI